MTSRFVCAASFVGLLAAPLHAPPVAACSFEPGPEARFFLFEAPVGGLWWVHTFDIVGPTVPLTDASGDVVEVDVVSVGAQTSKALRVPNVAVGTRFILPDAFDRPLNGPFDQELIVAAGAPPTNEAPPPAPAISVENREARVGYTSVLVSPIGGECSHAVGFWNFQYDERPFLVVDDPGDDFVLDVQLQTPDEAPFEDVESANEILFDARSAAPVDLLIQEPPETIDVFAVHARLRRISDGAASNVVSVDVALDDVALEERIEWVGCTCANASPGAAASWGAALLALRIARRRNRTR